MQPHIMWALILCVLWYCVVPVVQLLVCGLPFLKNNKTGEIEPKMEVCFLIFQCINCCLCCLSISCALGVFRKTA